MGTVKTFSVEEICAPNKVKKCREVTEKVEKEECKLVTRKKKVKLPKEVVASQCRTVPKTECFDQKVPHKEKDCKEIKRQECKEITKQECRLRARRCVAL